VLASSVVYRFQEMLMEMTPEGTSGRSPAKRAKRGHAERGHAERVHAERVHAESKVTVKPAADEAPPAKKPRAPRKTLTIKSAEVAEPSSEDLGGMIATAAYYLAAARNFTPGHELDDWLEAERSVRARLYG
jgi:hypothetical protein